MLVPFEELPESARIWIYQADKILGSAPTDNIIRACENFCREWSAHNTPLKSSFKVLHNKFLILAVDEEYNIASGCSIDASVRFIQSVEQQLDINFFDRTQVAFLIDDNVYTTGLQSIKDEINHGKIVSDTLTFNLQAQNIGEFQNNWLVPAQESWMKRYF
jgi:hypothetical protein